MTTAIGVISLDNYDDIIDKMDDKNISYLNTFITTVISDWATDYHIFYKRINAERYFFVTSLAAVEKMKEQKFELLNRVKEADINSELSLTVSMGIAYGDDTTDTIGEIAQSNLELALARGGDQVVLKDTSPKAKPQFFGGRTEGSLKRTRTRSRAMSVALKRIFKDNQKIFIMGHRFPDMDAVGSAFGVATLAKFSQKECAIIINREEASAEIERCFSAIEDYAEFEQWVLTEKEALEQIDKDSLLVMVDYHKPSMSISPKVYEAFDKVVIIDHHRRGNEFPDHSLLTYIETAASSASELVTELIQYQSSKYNRLPKFIATLLLAGIYVDTKRFSARTTGRTFNIAGYLRNQGADLTQVQHWLSSDFDSYMQISELISRSERLTKQILLTVGSEDKKYDTVTIAKTADTLLGIKDVEVSFVVGKRLDDSIGISARSSGKVNVQNIMEVFGGGGHFTNAAAQIKGETLEKVREMLFNELRRMKEKEQSI
ncbi:DHH family phosphoesterase [Enterococcus olivae]